MYLHGRPGSVRGELGREGESALAGERRRRGRGGAGRGLEEPGEPLGVWRGPQGSGGRPEGVWRGATRT